MRYKLTDKRVFLIVVLSLKCLLIVLGILFGLSFLHAQQYWLDAFDNSFDIDRNQPSHQVSRKIELWQVGVLSASFDQDYMVDLTGNLPYAQMTIQEQYFAIGTAEFDTTDQYVLQNGVMSVTRTTQEETVSSSSQSDIYAFWQIVDEKIGGLKYEISSSNFSSLSISHNSSHSLVANVLDDKQEEFFGIEPKDMNNVQFNMTIGKNLLLQDLRLQYDSLEDGINTTIISTMSSTQQAKGTSRWQTKNTTLLALCIVLSVAIVWLWVWRYITTNKKPIEEKPCQN